MFKILYFIATLFRGVHSMPDVAHASVCIGDRCGGDMVSAMYLQENHWLASSLSEYRVRSFQITYDDGENATRSVKIEGNDLATVLPDLQGLKSGSKFYVDQVVLEASEPYRLQKTFMFRME